MRYSELLKMYIKESRLKLEEISSELKNYNLSASREYLSRLQNGKTAPASEDLNRALAKILNADEDKLITAAYVEKTPIGVIRDSINFSMYEEYLKMFRSLFDAIESNKFTFEIMKEEVGLEFFEEKIDEYEEKVKSPDDLKNFLTSNFPFIKDVLFPSPNGDYQTIGDDENLHEIAQRFGAIAMSTVRKLNKEMTKTKVKDRYKMVPLYQDPSYLISPDESIRGQSDEGLELVNVEEECDENNLFMFFSNNDLRMYRIKKKDKIVALKTNNIKNGDLLVVNENNQFTIKVALISKKDNKTILIIDEDGARELNDTVMGKVIQVIFIPETN